MSQAVITRNLCGSCGTLSAYDRKDIRNLGCVATQRPQANGCNRFAVSPLSKAVCAKARLPRSGCTQQPRIAARIPRSGYTQQPGVAAQRRTPGYEGRNANAEGVLQPVDCRFDFNPKHIVRRFRFRTCDTNAETRLETIPTDDERADRGCTLSTRRHVTGLPKTLRNRSAIETRATPVAHSSPISMIHVSIPGQDRQSNTFSRADIECERDLPRPRSVLPVNRDYGRCPSDIHADRFGRVRPSEMACGIWSKTQCADKPVKVTGPCWSLTACGADKGDGCRTLSAYDRTELRNPGCAAARRPQANGYNRFAVLMLAMGEAHCV